MQGSFSANCGALISGFKNTALITIEDKMMQL